MKALVQAYACGPPDQLASVVYIRFRISSMMVFKPKTQQQCQLSSDAWSTLLSYPIGHLLVPRVSRIYFASIWERDVDEAHPPTRQCVICSSHAEKAKSSVICSNYPLHPCMRIAHGHLTAGQYGIRETYQPSAGNGWN